MLYGLLVIGGIWVTVEPVAGSLLEMGRPSPPLAAMTYLRGEAVEKLSPGTIYVIEFSGTTCVPCIQAIPHMNELQRTHANVVFVSVFSEPEQAVRPFLADRGQEIAVRVAADPDGRMGETWSTPACQEGIPHVFVVGRDGKIAWIGHPLALAAPLADIVAGRFDPRVDEMRLKVEQGAVLKDRRLADRERKGHEEYNRINQMVIAGQHAAALVETETALTSFQDCPAASELLRDLKLYLLILHPQRQAEALPLALDLAIEARRQGRPLRALNLATTCLNAVDNVQPAERDLRIVNLALALLSDQDDEKMTSFVHEMSGRAHHLRGDRPRAVESIRAAIRLSESDAQHQKELKALLDVYSRDATEK